MAATRPVTPASAEVRPGEYGDRVVAVEPGGIEPVAAADRHGRPRQLFWTWSSPNLEFATIFVGVLGVSAFGLSFWQTLLAAALGNALGALSHGVLSARGPKHGVPQMVLSRLGFGYWGNLVPAALMSVTAGIGWFAVNSVSGAFALNTLTGLPVLACLVIVVVLQIGIAFFGHNLVQAYEKYIFGVLAVIFLVATVYTFTQAHPGAAGGGGGTGGFLLTMGAAFGYAAGWNPYAADYTRYLPSTVRGRAVGWYAALGLFLSCTVLMAAGAASATIGGAGGDESPTAAFTGHMPGWLSAVTLLAIALGAVAANALNVYSGALAFLCLGIRLPLAWRRAIVALGFGAVGFALAWAGLSDAGAAYEHFLLVIAYWIAPWLGVVFADQYLRRGRETAGLLADRSRRGWAGLGAFLVGAVVSIALFANQSLYTGPVPKAVPAIGDITFFVGFALAGGLYAVLGRRKLV
ncbi:purine-cytosine permease family protein [Amycolatopsis sacchari]|uniref:purine-cytosine permease family protein n=1 Tax=Amycolatopsis sacchari TaxID=115433 RepID=UPI000B8169BC|nr:cytosine permease [Amycolatopsis sacchari]